MILVDLSLKSCGTLKHPVFLHSDAFYQQIMTFYYNKLPGETICGGGRGGGGVDLYGGVKIIWGVIFITIISLFHFFRNSQHQKSEVFLLRISSGNMNALVVVTCQYPQIY